MKIQGHWERGEKGVFAVFRQEGAFTNCLFQSKRNIVRPVKRFPKFLNEENQVFTLVSGRLCRVKGKGWFHVIQGQGQLSRRAAGNFMFRVVFRILLFWIIETYRRFLVP